MVLIVLVADHSYKCTCPVYYKKLSLCVRIPTFWVPTRSDTNRAVQSQKMVRGWKFWNYNVEELYYPCSEIKGADQLRSYFEADLRLCFHLCRFLVFPCGGSNSIPISLSVAGMPYKYFPTHYLSHLKN